MSLDIDCECGNPDCCNTVMVRKGPVWFDGMPEYGYLHVDAMDTKNGYYVEFILTKSTARQLAWWLIKNFWRVK